MKKIWAWRLSLPWNPWSLGAGPLLSYTGPRQGKDTRDLRIWGMSSSVERNFARKFPMFYRKELSWNHLIQGWLYVRVCVCVCLCVCCVFCFNMIKSNYNIVTCFHFLNNRWSLHLYNLLSNQFYSKPSSIISL